MFRHLTMKKTSWNVQINNNFRICWTLRILILIWTKINKNNETEQNSATIPAIFLLAWAFSVPVFCRAFRLLFPSVFSVVLYSFYYLWKFPILIWVFKPLLLLLLVGQFLFPCVGSVCIYLAILAFIWHSVFVSKFSGFPDFDFFQVFELPFSVPLPSDYLDVDVFLFSGPNFWFCLVK